MGGLRELTANGIPHIGGFSQSRSAKGGSTNGVTTNALGHAVHHHMLFKNEIFKHIHIYITHMSPRTHT